MVAEAIDRSYPKKLYKLYINYADDKSYVPTDGLTRIKVYDNGKYFFSYIEMDFNNEENQRTLHENIKRVLYELNSSYKLVTYTSYIRSEEDERDLAEREKDYVIQSDLKERRRVIPDEDDDEEFIRGNRRLIIEDDDDDEDYEEDDDEDDDYGDYEGEDFRIVKSSSKSTRNDFSDMFGNIADSDDTISNVIDTFLGIENNKKSKRKNSGGLYINDIDEDDDEDDDDYGYCDSDDDEYYVSKKYGKRKQWSSFIDDEYVDEHNVPGVAYKKKPNKFIRQIRDEDGLIYVDKSKMNEEIRSVERKLESMYPGTNKKLSKWRRNTAEEMVKTYLTSDKKVKKKKQYVNWSYVSMTFQCIAMSLGLINTISNYKRENDYNE